MSVVVNIKQPERKTGLRFLKADKVKPIDLKFLDSFCQHEQLYFGVSNDVYCIERYEGGEDIRNTLMVLYSRNSFGRGFSFTLDENYDLELVLNAPSTAADIEAFYKFIRDFCINFKLDSFLQEGESYSLDKIDSLKSETLVFHRQLVKSQLEAGLTIFGCIYPIVLEQKLIDFINSADEETAYEIYADYLHSKQQLDCYYAKPLIYQGSEEGKYIARYALTQDVPSIFPTENFLPFGYNQNLKENIINWNVGIVGCSNGEYQLMGELPYDEFCRVLDIEFEFGKDFA